MTQLKPLPPRKLSKWRYELASQKSAGRSGPRPKFEVEDNRKVIVTLPRVSLQHIPEPPK